MRCAPQFTGVLWDTLAWVERWLETEINSSTDNPLFDAERGIVISGGNFAGGHVALAMDALKTAVASVGDLMDRQLELVVDEKFSHGLSPNLIAWRSDGDPQRGLDHGFKGMQLACSSLTADALSRCMPLSVFSRSTECHNQDKVRHGGGPPSRRRAGPGFVRAARAITGRGRARSSGTARPSSSRRRRCWRGRSAPDRAQPRCRRSPPPGLRAWPPP